MSTKESKIEDLPELEWSDSENINKSINKIYEYVLNKANDEKEWYKKEIRRNKIIAFLIRVIALLLIGLSGIVPLYNSIIREEYKVSEIWITLFITVAAGLLAFDKYMGFSTAWIRYIKTHQFLESKIDIFELKWQIKIMMKKETDNKEIVDFAINFLYDIRKFVQNETKMWIDEFFQTFSDINSLINKGVSDQQNSNNFVNKEGSNQPDSNNLKKNS